MITTLQMTGMAVSVLFAISVFFLRRLVLELDKIVPAIHNLDTNVAVLIKKSSDHEREMRMVREKQHGQSNQIAKLEAQNESTHDRLHSLEGGQRQVVSWFEERK